LSEFNGISDKDTYQKYASGTFEEKDLREKFAFCNTKTTEHQQHTSKNTVLTRNLIAKINASSHQRTVKQQRPWMWLLTACQMQRIPSQLSVVK
jgi:hypothetical protein